MFKFGYCILILYEYGIYFFVDDSFISPKIPLHQMCLNDTPLSCV